MWKFIILNDCSILGDIVWFRVALESYGLRQASVVYDIRSVFAPRSVDVASVFDSKEMHYR